MRTMHLFVSPDRVDCAVGLHGDLSIKVLHRQVRGETVRLERRTCGLCGYSTDR